MDLPLSNLRMKLRVKLFSADIFLQKAILEVQSICESASSSSFSHYLEVEEARTTKLVDIARHTLETLGSALTLLTHLCSLQGNKVDQPEWEMYLHSEAVHLAAE